MAWAVGQRLQGSKYTIEQELGEGGFGITYRARDNQGRIVVIKTLNDTVQRRPDFAKFQQDFLNEALRLAKCSHPHIVQVDEVIQEGQPLTGVSSSIRFCMEIWLVWCVLGWSSESILYFCVKT